MAELLNLEVDSCVTVNHGETFGSEEFKLLEVDESLLKELMSNGLTIKGDLNDEAVLCTASTTYAIKYVSTSNTVLLIPPGGYTNPTQDIAGKGCDIGADINAESVGPPTANVLTTIPGYLELVETAPRLDKLKCLLNERPYTEELDEEQMLEEDSRGEQGLYSLDELVSRVQASHAQIIAGLQVLQAVEIGNYWRVVDGRFLQGLLDVLLLTAVQHDWDLKLLQESEVIKMVRNDGYSPHIIRHCLACYGDRVDAVAHEEEPGVHQHWKLDEGKVCLHYAKQLLRAASKWKLDDFLEAWKSNVPTGFQPTLEMAKGEVLTEKLGPEVWLQPFSVSSLPTKPAERFSALFQTRSKWEWEDLEPYLRGMQAPGQSVEAMLLKFTRKVQIYPNSPVIYTRR